MRRRQFAALAAAVAVALLSVSLTGCSGASSSGTSSYKNVTAADVKQMLDAKEDVFLLDVHIPEQIHISGTDAFIPFNAIGENLGKLPADKNAKIVVYCRSGNMSQEASAELIRRGYTDVSNMEGGIYAWKAAGYPVP